MKELCASTFEGAEFVSMTERRSECSLEYLIQRIDEARGSGGTSLLVASRDKETSLEMSRDVLRAHPEVQVIWMLRNPLDVLTSEHPTRATGFYVDPDRLRASLDLYERFMDEPQVTPVRYEDLVAEPDRVQQAIASRFGLRVLRPFSEGYRHFSGHRESVAAMHSIRPIDQRGVDRWRQYPDQRSRLQSILSEHPSLVALGRRHGYEMRLS
jgi:hypothetical protein